MINLKEEAYKVQLREQLKRMGYGKSLIESIIESLDNIEEPAYICRNSAELNAAIQAMLTDEGDED